MPQAEVAIQLSKDGLEACIGTMSEGKLSPLWTVSGSELEGLICQLGELRAAMPEQVPMDLDEGSRLPALVDYRWNAFVEQKLNKVSMAIRHPGFGWLGFLYSANEARNLGRALVIYADQLDGKSAGAAMTPTPPPARGLPGLTGAAPPINIGALLPPRKA